MNSIQINDARDAYELTNGIIGDLDREVNLCLHLNSQLNLNGIEIVSIGTDDSALLYPVNVIRGAILNGTVRIVMVHNHPSGGIEPSYADIEVTKRLIMCCKLMNMNLMDSVIIGDHDYFSMGKTNWFQEVGQVPIRSLIDEVAKRMSFPNWNKRQSNVSLLRKIEKMKRQNKPAKRLEEIHSFVSNGLRIAKDIEKAIMSLPTIGKVTKQTIKSLRLKTSREWLNGFNDILELSGIMREAEEIVKEAKSVTSTKRK